MHTVGAYEAKTHLSELLDRVEKGERFVITRNGRPSALLQSTHPHRQQDLQEVVASLRAFRKDHRLESGELRAMIAEGRR